MHLLSHATAYTVRAEPCTIEIDAEEQMSVGDPSWWMVGVPVIAAVLSLIQNRTPDKANHLTAITRAYQDQATTSAAQIKTLTEQGRKPKSGFVFLSMMLRRPAGEVMILNVSLIKRSTVSMITGLIFRLEKQLAK
ncbi:MAG: hypothetical protein HLX46_05060 [Corynebacterium sp.]|uniref:hypothetical protein n=1 Tax=Corynebacterium sp. TaxID=1720 RepID=UPI00181628AA|nr:hypothetical protein [Corynebacterium sp.]NWO16208.1 hypothetical protein [Corynebacterium sp.]